MSNDQKDGWAQLLMTTFPGHPARHLQAFVPENGELKKVREIASRANYGNYQRHLAAESLAGPGAVGVMPGIRSGSTWRTPWAVMDFDSTGPTELAEFFSVLSGHGLEFTFSTGSTGRGCHVWFLLDQAVTLTQAHKALAFLKRVVGLLGFGQIDLRPDGSSENGAGIMLPYRGAIIDGFGANPLWSPVTGAQINLEEVPGLPRQEAKAFVKLGTLRSPERFLAGTLPTERPRLTSRLETVLLDPSFRWNAELDRLSPLWEEGRRHHLTVAVTAYGVSLKVDPDTIREDVLALVESCNDEEAQSREQAIELGLARSDTGKTLSADHFYELAEVESPRSAELTEVRSLLEGGRDDLMARSWPSKSGKTDRSLYKTMLLMALEHGYLHPDGVELSVAWSQLSHEANIGSSDTLGNSLARLEDAGLIGRANYSSEGKSGSFVLLVTKRSILLRGGIGADYFGLSPALRNGSGSLGKTREQVLDLLIWYGPQTREELAAQMQTRWNDLNKSLARLLSSGVVREAGSGKSALLELVENWLALLEHLQNSDGSEQRREGQKGLAQEKTKRFRLRIVNRQQANQTPTASESSATSSPNSSAT